MRVIVEGITGIGQTIMTLRRTKPRPMTITSLVSDIYLKYVPHRGPTGAATPRVRTLVAQ
jgi:hypothetical protein